MIAISTSWLSACLELGKRAAEHLKLRALVCGNSLLLIALLNLGCSFCTLVRVNSVRMSIWSR